MLNTSAITVVIKSSVKPQSNATTNHHLHGSVVEKGMENKGKLHDASIGTAAVGKKAHLGMK